MERLRPMISIIIPFYQRYDLIMRRMLEIHTHIHHPNNDIEILMVNNGSDPAKVEEGNIYYWQKMVGWFSVRYLTWEKNVGFGGAMNRGAEAANGDNLIFLSDDVRISGDFLPLIVNKLNDDPTSLVGGEMVWWPAGWNEFEVDGKPVVVPYLNGWLLACRKEVWKESGGFDPIYYPYDYEDVDLSTRWHEMGYNLVALNTPLLSHIGGATISTLDANRVARTQQHRQKYIMKWNEKLLDISARMEKKKDGRDV